MQHASGLVNTNVIVSLSCLPDPGKLAARIGKTYMQHLSNDVRCECGNLICYNYMLYINSIYWCVCSYKLDALIYLVSSVYLMYIR